MKAKKIPKVVCQVPTSIQGPKGAKEVENTCIHDYS